MFMIGLCLIVFLLLIGAVVYALSQRLQINQSRSAQTIQTPEEILKARYARDEISREEYEQIRQDLES